MRFVRVLVSDAQREDVLAILDDRAVDCVLTAVEGENRESTMLEFPLPTRAVDELLDDLHDVGVDEEYLVVTPAEVAQTPQFSELEERFRGYEEDSSIAPEEIRSQVFDMRPGTVIYYTMALSSAIVATAGLLLGSTVLVVASMVIEPHVGSALTTSVGVTLNDRDMMVDGLGTQVFGVGTAITGAALFGSLIRMADFVPPALNVATTVQIVQTISPGFLTTGVAIAAGLAGAFSLASDISESLVGVMIAATIVPAAASIGIGLAWNLPSVTVGAFVLLSTNVAAINLAGIAGLVYMGYRPGDRDSESSPSFSSLWPALASLMILVGAFTGAGVVIGQNTTFENRANSAITDTLAQPKYARLTLVEVNTEFRGRPLHDETNSREVSVVLERPDGQSYPQLAGTLQRQVSARTGQPVVLELQYRDRKIATPAAAEPTG